jgi:transcription initiation factor TFIIIB Brf1 subunit/transcription initiation factor TFIIB
MIKIVAIIINGGISQCPNCGSVHGLYDTKTKKTVCYQCKKEIKK